MIKLFAWLSFNISIQTWRNSPEASESGNTEEQTNPCEVEYV